MARTTHTTQPAASAADDELAGAIYQWELPEWQPLMELVGELATWFMWMGELRLDDGTRLHAYKHAETRRYAHIAADGRTFRYLPPARLDDPDDGAYREISRATAIDEAFLDWSSFHENDWSFADEVQRLSEVRALAVAGELAPYPPEFLARQRRFEAAVVAARLHEKTHDPGFSVLRFGDDGHRYFGDLESVDEATKALEQRAS